MITVEIDELTHCLVDAETNEEVQTIVRKISKPSELKGYNSKNGWYVNWQQLYKDNEIYALYVVGEPEIQGLVALHDDVMNNAVFGNWIVANPCNNGILAKKLGKKKKYLGVGGHLFAIACNRSLALGHGGYMYGYAANTKLLEHYIKTIGATPIEYGYHPYTFEIPEPRAIILIEEYSYDFEIGRESNKSL